MNIRKHPVALDRERHLSYSMNALCRFQQATGLNVYSAIFKIYKPIQAARELESEPERVEAFVRAVSENSMVETIRAIIWAGLIDEDPDVTIDQVGAMIDWQSAMNILNVVVGMFGPDLPGEVQSKNPPAPQTQNRGTGDGSGVLQESIFE